MKNNICAPEMTIYRREYRKYKNTSLKHITYKNNNYHPYNHYNYKLLILECIQQKHRSI